MVSQTYDLKSLLQQGTYDGTGTAQTSTTCVRTSQAIECEPALYNAEFELEAVLALPMSGSPSGENDLKIPALSQLNVSTYLDNPNYEIEYYWFTISRQGYDDGHGGNYWRVGSCALVIPVVGGNKENESPIIYGVQNAAYTGSGSGGNSTRYIECDVSGNYLKYSDNGTIYETTVAQFILGSILHYDTETDSYSATRQAERDSEFVQAEAAFIGYTLNNANSLIVDERWIMSGDTVNLADYIPCRYVKAVIRVDEETEIQPNYITKATLKLENSSWELLDSGKIYTYPILSSIETDVFVTPYPATFWYLDNTNKLHMGLIPSELIITNGIVHDNPNGNEYFNISNNDYNAALQSAHNAYRIRLEILSDDESVIGEITKDLSLTAAGQITINYEQITRRSCSLSLINVENKYIPTKNSPFWLNRKFKLWLGAVVGKDTYWWSEGVFYTVSANANGRVLNIEGVDKGGALDGTLKLNMTEAQYQFGHNVPITEIIKQSLSLDVGNPYGATSSPIGYGGNRPVDCKPPLVGIEYYGFKTVSDISIDANAYISELFVQMGELYAADCYYNTDGYLMFVPHIDSTGYKYAPTQWEFTDLSNTYEDVNYEYNFEGENVVTVYTNTSEAGVRNVAWTAYNTNPLSPINVSTGIRRAEHIEIPYYYNADLDREEQERQQIKDCRSAANHYLLASSMVGMTLTFNTPIIPHMDVNKTIQITDQYADIEDGIYVVQSLTIPLSGDKMQVTATNINWLPNDMSFSGVSEVIESEEGGAGNG